MKNLKQLRADQQLTQTDIAEKLNVTKQTVYKWERGMSPVAVAHWDNYAHILRVNRDQFEDALIETLLAYALETLDPQVLSTAQVSGKYDAVKMAAANTKLLHFVNQPISSQKSEVKAPQQAGGFVPVISSAAAATCNPGLMPLLDCVQQHSDEQTWFRQAKQGDFVIEVVGHSMSPWYPEGTLLLVRPYQRLRNGQRVVAVLDEGEIVFKVYAEKDNKICLLSLSEQGKDFIFEKPQIPIRYICLVIASQRSEDDIDEKMHEANILQDWRVKFNNL